MNFKSLISIICLFFIRFAVCGASPEKVEGLLKNEIRLLLNDDGSAYSKISFASQFWMRNTQLNEGTTSQNGDFPEYETDFALRRIRLSMYNSLNDRIVVYTQLGFNNLCATSSKPQIYFHDVWSMFRIAPKAFFVGFGLNGWNGISRLTNTSFQKTMTLDNPGVNIPNVNHADLETRQLGLFAKGTVGRISYRAALAKPFLYNGVPINPEAGRGYEFSSTHLAYKAYAVFHFWDKEYFNTPYLTMTYLGTKRICNVGAGFDIYPHSVAEFDEEGTRTLKNRNLFGIDWFLELPFDRGKTISAYSVFYSYDFGKNYLRRSGVMNIWSGGSGQEGAGNNEFKIGTGTIWYTVLGYLFQEQFLHVPGRIQMFYSFSGKDFEALSSIIWNHDLGMNYYLGGQKLKFSLQYSLRPSVDELSGSDNKHLGSMIFQVQLVI